MTLSPHSYLMYTANKLACEILTRRTSSHITGAVRPRTLVGFVVALLLGLNTAASFGQMVNPSIDDPNREWCYLTKSTTVIGVPWQPDVVQVTWDGALYTGSAGSSELCFFYGNGNPPRPMMARQKTFLNGWMPIVEYDCQTNGVDYCVGMFSAVIAGGDVSNALQFVQVTVTNLTSQPTNAILIAACRGSGQDYRFGSPTFNSAWTFAITNNALIRNGQWVYGFDPAVQKVEAVQGVPYTGPFVGTTYGVTARLETGLATYNVSLQPGEAKSFRFKLPRVPVAVSNTGLINSITAADYDTYRSNTITMWQDLVGSRCHISIPAEPRVENAFRECAVHVLLATRTISGQQMQTDGLPYPGCFPTTHFDYELLYDSLQLPGYFEPTIQFMAQSQRANGQFDSPEYPNASPYSQGRVLMGMANHIIMTGNTNFAATIYTNIQRGVAYVSNQHAANTNGLVGPTPNYDNEMIIGYWTSDNLWVLGGLRKAICVARLMGRQQDVTNWTVLHDSFQQSVLQAIQSSAESDGYVPTGLGAFTFGNGDYDWENMLLAWPTETLAPSDSKTLGTVARVHKTRFHEGIMDYRNGTHEHEYITVNPAMQEVAAGNARQALTDLYHILAHCGPTSEGFENMVYPWQDRMLLLSPYVPTPHAWGATKTADLIRNCFVMEYGGRLGLDIGQRNLMLFSVVSPAWAIPGQTISVTNAGTEFGIVSAWMNFATNGAHVGLTNLFTSPPGQIVIQIPYFVTNVTYTSDAASSVLANNTLQLSPDATRVDFTWDWNTNAEPSQLFQNTVLSYRSETPLWPWSAGHNGAPPPAVGVLTTNEQQHAAELLSFSNILDAFKYEYAVRYTNFIAGGGVPDVIAAPTMAVAQTGTLLQYGFDATSEAVGVPGIHPASGDVHDDSGNGRDGYVLGGNGGVYTNDIPNTNKLQNCTGIGSVILATGSITTDPTGAQSGTGIVSWTDIIRNGGLTMETWVKGGGGSGLIFTIAGEYNIYATATGVGCANGFNGNNKVEAALDSTQWHHVAAEFINPSLNSSGQLVADLQLYVDGQLQGTYAGSVFNSDLQRGTSLGNHPLLNTLSINSPFTGLVFEPRITLGAVSPTQFTIKLAAVITITQQPVNVTVYAGSNAMFTVGATVTGSASTSLLYQWQKNHTNIPGATNTSYTTSPLSLGDTSQYCCVISTADGTASTFSATVQASVVPVPVTLLQWSFLATSGTVTAPIVDTSGAGHNVSNIIGSGAAPVYSPDIPTNAQFCTGIGSVSFSGNDDSGLSTGPLGGSNPGYPTAAQIVAAGGLTMEVWVKNPAVSSANTAGTIGYAFQWAAEVTLGVGNNGYVGAFSDAGASTTTWSTTNWSAGQWVHLALVLAQPNSTATLFTNATGYVNGQPVGSGTFSQTFRARNISAGLHEYLDKTSCYAGLIYEPRMTLGVLAPSQFTVKQVPPVLSFGKTAGGVVLYWTSGALETAQVVTGPWTVVANAVSPWTNNFANPVQFFRLQQ